MVNPRLRANRRGFTLLEVLIALVIMGLSLFAFFMAQSRAMRMAEKARLLTVATELARKKMIDCKYDVSSSGFSLADYQKDGNFEEQGHKEVEWACYAYPIDVPPPNADVLAKAMKSQAKGNFNTEMGSQMSSDMMAPFFNLISTTLGESIRELALVVRWNNGEYPEEMRIVTHLVNRGPLAILSSQLPTDLSKAMPPGLMPPGLMPPQKRDPK